MISVLAPSRGRPGGIARLHDSLTLLTVGDWEMVVRLDDDDPAAPDYQRHPKIRYLSGPRAVLSSLWNECWREAEGPVFGLCADDLVFRTPGWDRIVEAAFPDDGVAFVHGDDMSGNDPNLATHGFLRREWCDTVGTFTPPHFSSDYNDTWIREVADALGRRVLVPIVTEHLHFSFGKGTLDLTHAERLVRHWKDDVDATWTATAPERQKWVDLLRATMVEP